MTEVDKARAIAYYESLSKNYERLVSKGLLRVLRDRERSVVLELAAFSETDKRSMIDVGCGGGAFALAAKQAGLTVWAVDLSPGMVAGIEAMVDKAYVADLDTFELERKFDIVVCSGVLDFVSDPKSAVKNLCALTAPGGRLVIQAPRCGVFGWIYRFEKRIVGLKANLYSARWLIAQAAEQGLELMEIRYPLPTNQVLLFSAASRPSWGR